MELEGPKWNFKAVLVRASINLSAQVTKNSIYNNYCLHYVHCPYNGNTWLQL